ncbi:MAG: sulfur carrier protein ThiS [Pseudomonadota bacterium]|jgi:thiamine biosynthesis protein ThiS|nr:sulfur carrier protein ThiS [Pseudomonadota bacterium]|tara:strand:+ start:532 stop:729 length:198 start_codon:yes stop_codon:yes gene_type:complete
MKVLLNGSSYSVKNNCSVDSLIKNLDLNGKYAIEINQNIIPRSQYSNKRINSGDKIEIVQAIGGG